MPDDLNTHVDEDQLPTHQAADFALSRLSSMPGGPGSQLCLQLR
ncbi:hypothetical protein [Pelomonas sp. Root1217]|nr:hypothetical protein [Pelomonas sp. Root1217]